MNYGFAAVVALVSAGPAVGPARVEFDQRLVRGLYDYDLKSALATFADKHPGEDASGKALLVLGDWYFNRSELEDASRTYRGLLRESRYGAYHDQARYKLAWIHINQGKRHNFAEALRLLEQVARGGDEELRGLAAADLVFAWTEVKRPAEQAIPFFEGLPITADERVRALERLANRYFIKTEYQNALPLYRRLLELSPFSESRPDWEQRIRDSDQLIPGPVRQTGRPR